MVPNGGFNVTTRCPALCGACLPEIVVILPPPIVKAASKGGDDSSWFGIIGGIVGAFILALLIVGIIAYKRNQYHQPLPVPDKVVLGPPSSLPPFIMPPSYRSTTAAASRYSNVKTSWEPPKAPPYRPPPPYPGCKMPAPQGIDSEGNLLPMYVPPMTYNQANTAKMKQIMFRLEWSALGATMGGPGGGSPGSKANPPPYRLPPSFMDSAGLGHPGGNPNRAPQRVPYPWVPAPGFDVHAPYNEERGAAAQQLPAQGRPGYARQPAPYPEVPNHPGVFEDYPGSNSEGWPSRDGSVNDSIDRDTRM